MKKIGRWRQAQKSEVRDEPRMVRFGPTEREKELRRVKPMPTRHSYIEEKAGVKAADLSDKSILEIGGSTFVDLILHEIKTRNKMLLDPLPWARVSDDCEYVKAVGEYLPVKKGSVHICFTSNTIDHCVDPILALRQIKDVLTDDGCMVISCNVFAHWTRPLFPLFNRLDSPHPWHFTRSTFLELLHDAGFDCEVEFPHWTPPFTGWHRKISTLKVFMGRIAGLKQVQVRCKKTK